MRNATKYEVRPIHTMHIRKVSSLSFGYLRQSGIVNHNAKVIGHRAINAIRPVLAERFHGVSAYSVRKKRLIFDKIFLAKFRFTTIFFFDFFQFSGWNEFFSRLSFFGQQRSDFSHFTIWSHFLLPLQIRHDCSDFCGYNIVTVHHYE